jgi:hypothetical protein
MMSNKAVHSPGTVSKILWHFTGGPTWNAKRKRQNKTPKPAIRAYNNLISILETKELRVGQYKEVLNVEVPRTFKFDPVNNRFEEDEIERKELISAPVCCLSDIPIAHLGYHAHRYGEFAIGFYRDSVVKSGFNPVFYTLESTRIIKSVYGAMICLPNVHVPGILQTTGFLKETLEKVGLSDSGMHFDYIDAEALGAIEFVEAARVSFKRLLAFTKTFSPNEFDSIYCEREWRSTESYSFTFDDVAMIVLPKKDREIEYFSPFIDQELNKLKLTRSIPVIPWEDLIEH